MSRPERFPLFVLGAAVAAIAIGSYAPVRAQTGGEQPVTLDNVAGSPTGTLRMPASPARPPIVLLMAGSSADATGLATALAAEGVASLRQDGNMVTTDATAQWIALLRNDVRFPTVTVFAESGVTMSAAVVAARVARADGVITRGATTRVAADIARLVAKVGTATDAASIAAFARAVPVLGRRGAPSVARPTTARRSPRQVVMGSVGSVRVAIEWGAPQMRARDVWGGLVPWNAIWMPGADEATTITTDGPLTIGPLEVPAGDHTLYTFPTADLVQLIVSRDVGQFHTVKDESLFLGRVDMTASTRTTSAEGLTFALEGRGTSGTLKLMWDTREYSVPLSTKSLVTHEGLKR